jgi:hypothetical protein
MAEGNESLGHILLIPAVRQVRKAYPQQGHLCGIPPGESWGFLDLGGRVNFIVEKDKIRFEISMIPVQKANPTIHSQLLQLAKRIVK